MEVIIQLHAPAAVCMGKEPLLLDMRLDGTQS